MSRSSSPSPRRATAFGAACLAVAATALPLSLVGGGIARADSGPVYLDPSYSAPERAADLVARMTLAEKASEMNSSQAAAIPRLGVAAWGWWNEAAHGVACQQTSNNTNCTATTNTTSYPVALSAASTWDRTLTYQEGTAVSDEAREVEPSNKYDMDFYAPTVNLGRDPRWGRNDESWSEDPYLTSSMASQYVDGLQGQDSSGAALTAGNGYLKAGTTIKHYALNNSENNRLNGNSVTDDRTLREYYTKQFRDLIAAAHPTSIMSSYNEINGTPSPADTYLNTQLARETFGFQGYFSSDCDAIYEEQSGHAWTPPGQTTAVNAETRHAWALGAGGEDLDCNQGYNDGKSYANELPAAVTNADKTSQGTLTENDLDVSLVRLFTLRMRTGEFDAETNVPWIQQARQRLSAEATAAGVSSSTWTNSDSNNAETETPARLALARRVGDESIVLLKNSAPSAGVKPLLPLQVPSGSPKILIYGPDASPAPTMGVFLGGYSSAQGTHGIANEVSVCSGLTAAIQGINPNATVQCLPGTSKQTSTPDPAELALARTADLVIAYATTDSSTSQEAQDRSTLTLPWGEESMITQLEANAPGKVIVDLETVGTVDVTAFAANAPAILWSSYNGMRKGESLADVLLGPDQQVASPQAGVATRAGVNPSGHLPFTWYAKTADLPSTFDYNIHPTATTGGRTYMYYQGTDAPSYPFGYGLSYSTFSVTNPAVSGTGTADANGAVDVTAVVTNTGDTAGAQVAQLYASQPDAPAALQRPAKRLLGFQKVSLAPHASKTLTFHLPISELSYFDQTAGTWTVDTGAYALQVATSAADSGSRSTSLSVTGTLTPALQTVSFRPVTPADAAAGITERVQFPSGTTITPLLTAGLSDDKLFGWISTGKSTDLPSGATVTWSSDRPSVVSTDGTTISTVGTGVATLTATVSYAGHTVTQSEPVLVTGAVAASALPETPTAALLPLAAVAVLGGGLLVLRRRRRA